MESTVRDLPESVFISEADDKGYGLFARHDIKTGEPLFRFQGAVVDITAVRNFNAALQINAQAFLESNGTFDELANHSCSPNCFLDFLKWDLLAKRNIREGEEITFDYHTTEFDLLEQNCSFECRCSSQNCVGEVNGFKHLSLDRKKRMIHRLSPFLREKLQEELGTLAHQSISLFGDDEGKALQAFFSLKNKPNKGGNGP